MNCVFCSLPENKIIVQNDSFIAVHDALPVKPGHILIISKRHAETIFDLNEQEFCQLHEIIHQVKEHLDSEHEPDGYNIGANCGSIAGQTVHHFHLHIIPRYKRDHKFGFIKNTVRNLREYHLE